MKGKLLTLSILALVSTLPAAAYYHFLHYGANGAVIPEKYNLPQLQNSTITFLVSDAGPASYLANDSFPSVVNQIRRATQVWNGVTTSALRVAFGGLYTVGTADNSPGGVVVFEDLPPGVLAYSGPTVCEDLTPNGPPGCQSQIPFAADTFLPILRSTMHMSRNLTNLPGPSYSETFFLVSVHEMGHALGLQHTFASSTMSTITTRATSLSAPLGADDRAGISELYPAASFASQFGSISGQITYGDDNSPVHMASVVAFSNTAPTVSAVTLADGTFQMNGVQPGQYYLYVHPLPPTADIESPRDANGNAVDPSQPFDAVVYPGALSTVGGTQVTVTAGNNSSGYNVAVTRRADVPIYDVAMYSYFPPNSPTATAVHPAYINQNSNPGTVVAYGVGIADNGTETSGLNVQVLGSASQVYAVSPYTDGNGNSFLALYLALSNFGSPGAQHLFFSTADYLYLLPSAFSITAGQPPTISAVTTDSDGSVMVAGQGFALGTQIFFDSLPGAVQNRDLANGLIALIAPLGASGQTATLTAFNSDGQNSSFLQSASPLTFSYPTLPATSLSIAPASLPAGAEAMVTVTGTNTNFLQGDTVFAFGTHDVAIRNTFVLSPTQAIVDVGMPVGSAQVTTQVTALTGFQLDIAPQAFQLQSPISGLPAPYPILFNGVQGQTGSYAGAIVSLYGTNLQASNNVTPVVTINGVQANLLYTSQYLINLQIPSSLAPGIATLLVNNGSFSSYPVTVNIDPPQAVILSLQLGPNQPVDNNNSAQAGQAIDMLVSGFPNPGQTIDPSRVQVSVGGVTLPAVSVTQVGTSNVYDVNFVLSSAVQPGSQVPVIVYLDGLSSVQTTILVTASTNAGGI